MKVRLLQPISGVDADGEEIVARRGDVIDVPKDTAERMFADQPPQAEPVASKRSSKRETRDA